MTNEELYRQYLSGDAEAFEQLYLQMQGFIASVAKDAAQSFGCADKEMLDELCAEGALELCERLSTGEYDENRGKLTTYLHPFLRGKMYRYLEANVGAAALVDLLKDGCMQGVDSVVSGVALVGKTLGGAVLKALLDDEGYGDVVALIYAVAGDEAVHARAQHEALDACGEYNVEVAVFILLKPCVFLCKKSVHRAQVNRLFYKRLVVGAIGEEICHKRVHCGDFVAQPIAVKTVAALFLSGFQCKSHLSA